MAKLYCLEDLTEAFYSDLTWRRKELSDIKAEIKISKISKNALLRALIAMGYAHWEGYVRTCARHYFAYLTLRNLPFSDLERQIYVNKFLGKLEKLRINKMSLKDRCNFINEIIDGGNKRFSSVDKDLIDTKSNLNTDVIKEVCIICNVDWTEFENERFFIDDLLLKRRNAIAHGQQEYINVSDMDEFVAKVISLMELFKNLLENKVYSSHYIARRAPPKPFVTN